MEFLIFGASFLVYMLVFSKRTYSYSSALPTHLRKQWIALRHPKDYSQWIGYESLLMNHFPYYKLLSAKNKIEFLVRLTDVKNHIILEGRESLSIDEQKSILVSASLTQITFGYKHYRFTGFKKIIIYPEIFYSKFLDADVKGVTYGSGFICLSWPDFNTGYVEYSDKLNLGLHEFAHALIIEKGNVLGHHNMWRLEKMMQFLENKQNETQEADPLFRAYGFKNIDEFWAVAVEIFFEQPIELKTIYPNLYRLIADALNQDMAAMLQQYLRNKN